MIGIYIIMIGQMCDFNLITLKNLMKVTSSLLKYIYFLKVPSSPKVMATQSMYTFVVKTRETMTEKS